MNVGDIFNSNKPELTQDKTYNVGQISEKTGLQKQSDGSWAPPKNGGQAKKEKDAKASSLSSRMDEYLGMKQSDLQSFSDKDLMSRNETLHDFGRMNPSKEDFKKIMNAGIETENELARRGLPTNPGGIGYEDTKKKALSKEEISTEKKRRSPNQNDWYDENGRRKTPYPHGWEEGDIDAAYEYEKRKHPGTHAAREDFERMAKTDPMQFQQWMEEVHEEEARIHADDSAPLQLTGDSSIKLSHIVRDKRYNIGDISEKTGLQKTANGWVAPKETKYGKVTEKNGQIGIQQKLGKGSQFMPEKSEAQAKRSLANLTSGYNTTERSKQDPHSDNARFMKHLDKETQNMARENKQNSMKKAVVENVVKNGGDRTVAEMFTNASTPKMIRTMYHNIKPEKPRSNPDDVLNNRSSTQTKKMEIGSPVKVKVNGGREGKIVGMRGDVVTVEMPASGNLPARRDTYYKSDLE